MNVDVIRGVLMALAAAVLWGTTGTAQQLAATGLAGSWVGALRLLVAALFFVAGLLLLHRGRLSALGLPRVGRGAALAAGACVALYNLAFFAGLRETGIALGTAIAIGSGPLWAGLLQAGVSRRAPTAAWWLGTLVSVSGGVAMVLSAHGTTSTASPVGIAACLAAGFAYASYTLLSKRMVATAPAATVTLVVFGLAALMSLPIAWTMSPAPVITSNDALLVLYLGVVATGIAYLLFSQALRHLSGATGVTLALIEPVAAFLLAIVLVGERPRAGAIVGLLLVLGGVLVVIGSELRAADGRPVRPGRGPAIESGERGKATAVRR